MGEPTPPPLPPSKQPRIYKSLYPPTALPKVSLYSHVFPEHDPYNPEDVAFIDGIAGTRVTRAQVQQKARTLAFGLRNGLERLGLVNISRNINTVLVFSPNSMSYPIVVLACLAAGIKLSLASSAQTPPELAFQISDSLPTHLFVHPSLLPVAVAALEVLKVDRRDFKRRIILLAPTPEIPPEIVAEGWIKMDDIVWQNRQLHPEEQDDWKAHRTALLFYSSGTTGLPKGVELTHYNLTSTINMMRGSTLYRLTAGRDACLGVIPFFHVYGGVILMLYPLFCGITSIILPKFDPVPFLNAIQQYRVTIAYIAPPIALFLANSPLVEKYDVSSLRSLTSAAAPLSESLHSLVTKRLKACGAKDVHVMQGFGITELSPAVSGVPYGRHGKEATVGILLPNLETRLVKDNGDDADDGEAGEFWLRGPNVMKGYLRRPLATLSSITPDGWFQTGDIAKIDPEGYISIVDRKKELIKFKGYQVAPAELENVLISHPDIVDAGLIGVPDPADPHNELPRAYVVPRDASLIKSEKGARFASDVAAWVKTRVSHYKQLRGGVFLVEAIPRSLPGKILRKELKALATDIPITVIAAKL